MKAVFFDVDGTLIARDGSISAQTIASLRRLKEKGIRLFLATGRHTTELEEPLSRMSIDFDGYVTLNGQLTLDASFQVIDEAPIDAQDAAILLAHADRRSFPIVTVEKDRLYINYVDEYVRQAQDAVSMPVPPIGRHDGQNVYQFTAFIDDAQTAALTKQLSACKITRWNPYGIDIISKDGGKAKGIAAMLDHYQIPREETMSFGDGENDRDMLAYTGIGIAMKDADQVLKDNSDYITESAQQEGITLALQHFHLL